MNNPLLTLLVVPRQQGLGGIVEIPCLESSVRTVSVDGGLRPSGKGNHGLLIASFTTLSITSSPCKIHQQLRHHSRTVQLCQVSTYCTFVLLPHFFVSTKYKKILLPRSIMYIILHHIIK